MRLSDDRCSSNFTFFVSSKDRGKKEGNIFFCFTFFFYIWNGPFHPSDPGKVHIDTSAKAVLGIARLVGCGAATRLDEMELESHIEKAPAVPRLPGLTILQTLNARSGVSK